MPNTRLTSTVMTNSPASAEFVIDEPELIYLDGNSLGRLPKRSASRVRQVTEQEWGRRLIRGWNDGWFDAPQRIGAKIAKLVGAEADEVIVGDSTSLHLVYGNSRGDRPIAPGDCGQGL